MASMPEDDIAKMATSPPPSFDELQLRWFSSIVSLSKVPVLVGSSNLSSLSPSLGSPISTFGMTMMASMPEDDTAKTATSSPSSFDELQLRRYEYCFLWVNMSLSVLTVYLSQRVEEMFDLGMFLEVAEFYKENSAGQTKLRKEIGVAEFGRYFKEYPLRWRKRTMILCPN
ncbi:adenylate isopentenyltransferase-like [Rosa chinensis]|uniref:adenylate isopentenyltransferase-like n=1 Tax=Rosa chinensis TaxID=74649 RepID=UPI000D08683E|nr:adenylate isopentenyltransferase-like [Rosa chinensis]